MKLNTIYKPLLVLITGILLVGCAKEMSVTAPDTREGDQLQAAYMVNEWCTNRDLTADINREAGNSGLVNVSQQYWRFRESGKWEDSDSGWMYAHYGKWNLEGTDTLVLSPLQGKTIRYQASFNGGGANLQLEDDEGQFLVLSVCE